MDPFIAITLFAIGVLVGVITTKVLSSKQLPLVIANAKAEIETELATTGSNSSTLTSNCGKHPINWSNYSPFVNNSIS